MLPEVWGRHGWNFLHLVTLGYPDNPTDEDMKNYKNYIISLQKVLPCERCRNNMNKHMAKIPLTSEILSSRKLFIKWGIDFHNIVNYYTNKKMLTYPEAIAELEKLMGKTSDKKHHNYMIYLAAIIVVILSTYIIYRNYNQK